MQAALDFGASGKAFDPLVGYPEPRTFASGASDAPLVHGISRGGFDPGTTAGDVRSVLPHVEQHLARGGHAFVDSGAFNAYRAGKAITDFGPVLAAYHKVLDHAPDPSKVHVVAPDVVGDQAATMDLWRKHSADLDALHARGARVIYPLQRGSVSPSKMWGEVSGRRGAAAGIPGNAAAMPKHEVYKFLRDASPGDVHVLGMSPARHGARSLLYGMHMAHGAKPLNVTMDANRVRSKIGEGRPITEDLRSGASRGRVADDLQVGEAADSDYLRHDADDSLARKYLEWSHAAPEDHERLLASRRSEDPQEWDDHVIESPWFSPHDFLVEHHPPYARHVTRQTRIEAIADALRNDHRIVRKALPVSPRVRLRLRVSRDFVPTAEQVDDAARATDRNPSPAQKRAGNYRMGHFRWRGFDISIETPKGGWRRGEDKNGKAWAVKLPAHYGYLRGYVGRDKDPVDVIVGPHLESEVVFVVDQEDPRTGAFDEHKVVIGCRSVREARMLYLGMYSPGWKGLRHITPMVLPTFRAWLKSHLTRQAAHSRFTPLTKSLVVRIAVHRRPLAPRTGRLGLSAAGHVIPVLEDHDNLFGCDHADNGHETMAEIRKAMGLPASDDPELPILRTPQELADFVREHVDSKTPLYVRHSHGPADDARRGWRSMEYAGGQVVGDERGLSAWSMHDPNDTWGTPEKLAEKGDHDLIDYHPRQLQQDLTMASRGRNQTTYLLHGDRVMSEPDHHGGVYEAEGSDGEPLLKNPKPVAYVHPMLHALADSGHLEHMPVSTGEVHTLSKAVDRRGAGNLSFDFDEPSGEPSHPEPTGSVHHATLDRIPRPNLRDYDRILVNSSGGKDSQAMLHHVVHEAKKAGVLHRVHVVHADLGDIEWKGTKEIARAQAEHYGVPFHVVKRPQGDLLDQVLQRRKNLDAEGKHDTPAWPSSNARYCTSDHKRAQVRTLMTKLASDHKAELAGRGEPMRPTKILNCMGLRGAESPARSKKPPFAHDEGASNGQRHVDNWLPIHHWSKERVWDAIHKGGAPVHFAYSLGMPRVSCPFCIYAPKAALMLAGKHNPELLDRYVDVEDKVGHSFKQDLSLRSVRDALHRGEEPGEVKSWEM